MKILQLINKLFNRHIFHVWEYKENGNGMLLMRKCEDCIGVQITSAFECYEFMKYPNNLCENKFSTAMWNKY